MLLKFFRFYYNDFDPEKRLINVSWKGDCFVDKKAYFERLFHDELKVDRPQEHYFLIRDPFNNTYNPAKTFKIDRDRVRVLKML